MIGDLVSRVIRADYPTAQVEQYGIRLNETTVFWANGTTEVLSDRDTAGLTIVGSNAFPEFATAYNTLQTYFGTQAVCNVLTANLRRDRERLNSTKDKAWTPNSSAKHTPAATSST